MGWGLCLLDGSVWHHAIRRSRQSAKNDLERNRTVAVVVVVVSPAILAEVAPTASEANRKHTSKKLKASLDSLLLGRETTENTGKSLRSTYYTYLEINL